VPFSAIYSVHVFFFKLMFSSTQKDFVSSFLWPYCFLCTEVIQQKIA
jgi:hypothetical protein